jgi:ribosomal protein S18 acetylase RimI-like enzyme
VEVTFRLAETADIELLLHFMREYCAFDHLPFKEETRRRTLAQFISDERLGRLWVILSGGEAIGYLALTLGYSFEFGGYDAFIDEVYIRESQRGRGIGKLALQMAEDECRALEVRALHLEVERENTNAQALYRKVGFVDHNRYLMTKRIFLHE